MNWISVDESKPESGDDVLIYSCDTISVGCYSKYKGTFFCFTLREVDEDVTHWRCMDDLYEGLGDDT